MFSFLFSTSTVFGKQSEPLFPRLFATFPIDKMNNHVSMSTSLYLSSALLGFAYVIVTLIGPFSFSFFFVGSSVLTFHDLAPWHFYQMTSPEIVRPKG